MSQFFKRFLAEDASRLDPGSDRFLGLGAFGKHPGWDDHIEDLGLDSESLVLAKRTLYVQGVGGQIDTGAWEKLKPAERIEEFNHVFLWQRSGQFLVGRMWSSSDGKGRTRYPMVVCAHCIGAPASWGIEQVLPRLQQVEQACRATNSAAEVRSILSRYRAQLQNALTGANPAAESPLVDSQARTRFVNEAAFGPDQQGWFRALYHLQNQMASYRPGNFDMRGDFSGLRPQHMRVPAGALGFEPSVLLWSRLLGIRVDRFVPCLFISSPAGPWLDVIAGEPSSHEFFCLRSLPAALPLVTDVPYEMDEPFKAKARSALAEFQNGKSFADLGRAEEDQPSESESGGWISATARWFRKGKGIKLFLALCGGGILLGGGAALFLRNAPGKGEHSYMPSPPTAATTASNKPGIEKPLALPPDAALTQKSNAPVQGAPGEPHEALASQQAPKPVSAPVLNTNVQSIAPLQTNAQLALAKPAPDQPVPAAPAPVTQSVPHELVVLASTAPGAVGAASAPSVAPASLPDSRDSATAAAASALRKVLTNSIGMVLVWIAGLPGTAQGGYVAKYEVTQEQFERVMGTNPSQFKDAVQPVENVTWTEAAEFCRKLTASEANGVALPGGFVYRLPSQAQWEFFLGDARFEDAITSRLAPRLSPSPVGSLAANQFGLFDVLGNVWEFCSDSDLTGKILKGAAYNNRKLFGEKASEWKPLERTTPRRLASDARSPDAGFRCIATMKGKDEG